MAFPTLYEGANEDEFNGGRRSTLCRGHRNVVKIRPRLLCGNPIARWMRASELTFICMELALQTRLAAVASDSLMKDTLVVYEGEHLLR